MSLLALFRQSIGYSAAASLLQLATTLLIVRLAGPVVYADFTVDLYKLSVIIVCLEVVPSPYSIFQSQRRPELTTDLATFALVSAIFCLLAWAAMAAFDFFSQYSPWMAAYAIYVAAQRYLDIKLQAENRIKEFYQLMALSAGLRLGLTTAGLTLLARPAIDVLWASIAIGSLIPVLGWLLLMRGQLALFVRRGHFGSLAALFARRSEYYAYYPNTVLKRLRDAFMPIAASFAIADRVELARYLLAMRGVEAVMGQLRTVEAILANFENRAQAATHRTRHLTLLAILAQTAVLVASLLLTFQTGIDWSTVLLCFVASLFAYPYVMEIGYRSDAYAENVPARVTISLASFLFTLVAMFLLLDGLEIDFAPAYVLAHVLAQAVAALTYRLRRKGNRG